MISQLYYYLIYSKIFGLFAEVNFLIINYIHLCYYAISSNPTVIYIYIYIYIYSNYCYDTMMIE